MTKAAKSFGDAPGKSKRLGGGCRRPAAKALKFSVKAADLETIAARSIRHVPTLAPSFPRSLTQGRGELSELECLVTSIFGLFERTWNAALSILEAQGEREAGAFAQELADERYEFLCGACMELLPWTHHGSATEQTVEGESYETVCWSGSNGGQQTTWPSSDAEIQERLALLRSQGPSARALEALVAVLALLASRPQKLWLEAFDTSQEVARLGGRGIEGRRRAFREALAQLSQRKARGFFAPSLVDPTSAFRLALLPASGQWLPASLLLTREVPLREALERMDGGGPLKDVQDQLRDWSLELALQELLPNSDRQPALELEPDPRLLELLFSDSKVLFLEALAALAPQARAVQANLRPVIHAELRSLLFAAHKRGQAVVFMLGGEDPHALARKVYMRSSFTEFGLRCGYLRWRRKRASKSGKVVAWAREAPDRSCLGLQLAVSS